MLNSIRGFLRGPTSHKLIFLLMLRELKRNLIFLKGRSSSLMNSSRELGTKMSNLSFQRIALMTIYRSSWHADKILKISKLPWLELFRIPPTRRLMSMNWNQSCQLSFASLATRLIQLRVSGNKRMKSLKHSTGVVPGRKELMLKVVMLLSTSRAQLSRCMKTLMIALCQLGTKRSRKISPQSEWEQERKFERVKQVDSSSLNQGEHYGFADWPQITENLLIYAFTL